MSPATLTALPAAHERPTPPPPAATPAGDGAARSLRAPAAPGGPVRSIPAGTLVDAAAVDAARDAVARYLEELGLPLNSRSLGVAVAACLDAALGEVGPDADRPTLVRSSLRQAAFGTDRWLAEIAGRVPAPPVVAHAAARLLMGVRFAVPAERHRAMRPQRFGR